MDEKKPKSNLSSRFSRRIARVSGIVAIISFSIGCFLIPVGCSTGSSSSSNSDDGSFTIIQTVSDGAQRTTIAFSALAMMTGNLYSQSFFPPGKVADYTGFQYLRDNDPSGMGHNTSFLTRVACDIIYILDESQLQKLAVLASSQSSSFSNYGWKRYPLMQAFRRFLEQDLPAGKTALSESAVVEASKALYLIDGQISYDRAVAYAAVINSLTSDQKAYLDAMVGKGWSEWPDHGESDATVMAHIAALDKVDRTALYTYAGDIFSWYAGDIEADTYFCPERQGTYYGSFYMKDAPAVGVADYSISTELTATAGKALCDASEGYVTAAQAAAISSLVETQRNNLYAGTVNIVTVRREISALLRGLRTASDSSGSVLAQVLALSQTYGQLDGENNYHYASTMASVYQSLSAAQKTKLMSLRTSILSGTYSSGTSFDFTTCTTPYLYSAPITDTATLDTYIGDSATDAFFN